MTTCENSPPSTGPSLSDLAKAEHAKREQARRSFWSFRRYLHRNRKTKWGWWQREVAGILQSFWEELQSGSRPKCVIQAPPQHGKSVQVVEFLAWIAGKDPDKRVIYASFSERLGVRANLMLQRIYDSVEYKNIFPETSINTSNTVTISSQYLRNREILEYVGHVGYFRNTTVRGSVTGESLDIGIIDDPIKGREAAGSLTIRDGTWEWLTDDFFTRFSEEAGLLCILTRWHVDDPIGRLIANVPGVKVHSYPAIAVQDDGNRKSGDALFPEHKSVDFLNERKSAMASHSWEALYQQNPTVIGGEIIKGANFGRYSILPPIKFRKIFADTAQKTKERNDYSVFECWGMGLDGRIYLIDMIRGKWEAPELKRRAVDFWQKHIADKSSPLRQMAVEDKASGTGLIQEIKRDGKIPIRAIQRAVDKLTRVMDIVGYIESGYVFLPEQSPWVSDFIAECEGFTADGTHAHDDQIDPLCDAIDDMIGTSRSGMTISPEALKAITRQ